MFTVSGCPVVSGNTNDVGTAANVCLGAAKTIAVSNLTTGAFLGISTDTAPTASTPVTITTGAAAGDSRYFFSDNPSYSVSTATNGQVCLAYGVAYPAYLDGADNCVLSNYVAWAAQYGPDTNAEYEGQFLLNIDPATEIAPTSALLRVVSFNLTDSGYRFELASDIPGFRFFQPKGLGGNDDPTRLCNGIAVVEIATNLVAWSRQPPAGGTSSGASEIVTLPVPVTIDVVTGHAVIELDVTDHLTIPGFISSPSSLFFRPSITPVAPLQ